MSVITANTYILLIYLLLVNLCQKGSPCPKQQKQKLIYKQIQVFHLLTQIYRGVGFHRDLSLNIGIALMDMLKLTRNMFVDVNFVNHA